MGIMSNTDSLKSLRHRLCRTPASPLLVFGLSAAFGSPAQAGDAGALPQDPMVTAGNASFAQSGKTLTVNQTSNRAVIDWRSFDIGADAQANFNQPNSGSITVNRVNAGTDPTRIDGGLHANGQVWILNPNGVLFGATARVNAAGIVASTANIDAGRFMAGDNRLTFTGKDAGTVANDGHISVGESGLAAFVAPSVRNSGTITARTGKVTLAAGTTFTLDLAGDRLVEIGIGSDKAVVDQSGKIVDPGGTVQLSARAASEVVDGTINMSGVTRVASARRAGGDIILDGDAVAVSGTADASGTGGGTIAITGKTIDVVDSASLRADAKGGGQGGTITAMASLRGSYAGRYSARAGSGDGGKIETSGESVTTAPEIAVDASSATGQAGEWLIDPLNVTIASGTGGGGTGATVTVGAIQTALAGGTAVAITTDQAGAGSGDLTLAASINATSTGNAGLTLTGRHLLATGNSVINIAGGALTLNVNAVNANSTPPTGGWINDALGMIGTVSGGTTINLGAGTYTTTSGYINVNKSNVAINGAGQGLTILDSRSASTYGLRVTALNDVSLSGFTLYGATGTNAYGLKVEATTNLTLTNITSQGAAKSEFDLNGIIGGTLSGLTANGASVSTGVATAGNGISLTDSQNITLANSTTLNNQWGGLALYQSNMPSGYTFQEKNITVAAGNTFTEANPIYAEDQSATNDFGAMTLAGYNYVVQSPGAANDVYSWFQKTQQAAIDQAVNTGTNATVQGYAGNGQRGNNIFSIGYGTLAAGGTRALSIPAAISAALSGATINILSGLYTLAAQLNINKSVSLVGAGIGNTTLTSSSTGYGINVTADNVRLSGFTFNAPTAVNNATYGVKVTPDTNVASDRLLNFTIDHVKINGGNRTGLDLNGAVGATIDNVSVSNVVHGNGIALTDSANVTITNTTTSNNAWGGLALYQSNIFYNQQVNNISVDATNSFNDTIPVYAEDQSASLDVGTLALAGFSYVVKAPNLANDVYTWFQKTARAAVDFATNAALSNNNLTPATATVQGYSGNGVSGNNSYTVGIGSNGTAMSLSGTLNLVPAGATVNLLDGTYAVPGGSFLSITKSVSLIGQSEAGTIINASAANTYGLRVQADNVTLSNFTLMGATGTGGYGIKIEPLSTTASARLNNVTLSHVTINGSNKNALDLNGVHIASIDHVTAKNAVAGNGIAVIDSTDVTLTGSVTTNNAWGGLRIEEKNATYNQQTDRVTVDATNSFGEAAPVYLEDDSASQDFGTVTVQGFGFVVRAPSNPADVYTWLQKTQQGAIDYAANQNLGSATVQGWTGTTGNNHFFVGTGTLSGGSSRTLSIQSALNAAQAGAIIDVASGSYAESLTQGTRATMNFGTVTLGGSYTMTGSAANSILSGSLSATAANWAASINLGGALSLNTSAANGAITTAAIDGGQALTLNAGTGAISLGALGATTRLGTVTVSGSTTLTAGTYNGASLNFGKLILAADTNLNATSTIQASAIDGGKALTISAGSANLGALGAITRLGAVTDLSTTTLTSGTYNAASFNFGNLILAADTTLNATGAFIANAIDGARTLTVSAASANLGTVGATTRLGAVIVSGNTTLSGGTYNAASFNFGNLILAADTALNATGTFIANAIDGARALTISAGSASLGTMGATTRLGAVTDLSATTLTGGTYSAASFNFGNLILAADTTLNATGGLKTAAIDGNTALTISAGSASLGALGATTRLGAVTDLSATTLTGGTYNAASFNFGNLILAADTILNTTGTTQAGAIDGGQALTISASSASLGSLGATNRLGAVNDLATTTLTGDTYNAASLAFAGDVVLTGALTTFDTGGGDITIGGALLGSTSGAQSVTMNAGPGTGNPAQNGDILLQNVGTKTVALGSMTVAGDNFGAQTVNLAGDFHSTLLGNQVFSSHTLNAGGVVQSAVGGNASGPINAGGSVGLSVSGELSGAIGGSDINLNAGTIQGATVTATQGVTVNANTVAGSSLTGQTVTATAANFATDINAASVTLSAATITGSTITGSKDINISAATVAGSNLAAPTVKATATDSFSSNITAASAALNAGSVTGSTITGSSDIAVTARSVQGSSLAAPTVTAAATTFNSTVAASSGARITGTDVAGSFTGGSFTVSGSNSVNANIAANSATVSGNAITGSYTGNSVALSGGASVNATVTSNTLSVQAPSGNLQGSWANVDTGSSGTLVLNQQASIGNGNVGPSQLVVENFALPKGSSLTTRGDIVLPQNLMLGLLSPAGPSAPSFVVVQSVQQLGTLLSQNYSAIVIDLSGTARKDEAIN